VRILQLAALLLAAGLTLGSTAKAQPAPIALDAQWQAYKQRFISDEGRLTDDFAGNVSHSEGQGYAMLLAVFSDDRETFDKLWAWTTANLEIRDDGLASWRWRPQDDPHVRDKNNATDGDLLLAWALAEAGRKWDAKTYDAAAEKIAHAVSRKLVYPSVFGPVLSPGIDGFGAKDRDDGPVVNLSYWVFPAFIALDRVAPNVDWAGLRRSGLSLLDAARFGAAKLPSDWISLKMGVRPAEGYPVRFGYDIVRVPLYLAWGAPEERARLGALVDAWAGPVDANPPVVDLDTGSAAESFADPGYRAVAALARCVAHEEPFPAELKTVDLKHYYPATLQMLSLIALREGHFKC
jgi:endo-1,4-beta-D-glucanase Y